jgi:hypothetical protein
MGYKQLDNIDSVDLEYTETVADGVTSDWLGMPQKMTQLAIALEPAGTARVEVTLDREGAKNGTATPIAWPAGDVSAMTDDLVRGVAAVRVVSTSGAASLYLRGNRG